MTIVIISAGLIGLAFVGWRFVALVRRAQEDLDQLHANVRVLEGMTATSTRAERTRFERAKREERDLVQKLSDALRE